MTDGIDEGHGLGPVGHAFNGGKETAHEGENDHEKPGDEHSLLLGFGDGGDEEPYAEHDEHVDG